MITSRPGSGPPDRGPDRVAHGRRGFSRLEPPSPVRHDSAPENAGGVTASHSGRSFALQTSLRLTTFHSSEQGNKTVLSGGFRPIETRVHRGHPDRAPPASTPTSTPAGGTRPSGRASWPWTAPDRRRRYPAAAGQPRRRRGQRRRGHRNRLPGDRLGQRKPTAWLRLRRCLRGLHCRPAEGGARPERRAAPRREALPAAGKRPHPGRLRVAQRHQPPAHPQRRTAPRPRHLLLLRTAIGF